MLHPRDEGYKAYQECPRCPYDGETKEWYAWHMQGQVKIPYDIGTVEYEHWTEGWIDAHIEAVMP